MKMVSMKTVDESSCSPCEYDPSPCIYLNDDQVEALGIKGMPEPGTVFTIQARAVVTSVTARAESDEKDGAKPDVSLSLTLTEMGMSSAGASDGERATMLYGGM